MKYWIHFLTGFALSVSVARMGAATINYATYTFSGNQNQSSGIATGTAFTSGGTSGGYDATAGNPAGSYQVSGFVIGGAGAAGPGISTDYFSFSVGNGGGSYLLNFSSISFDVNRNGKGPAGFSLYASADSSFTTYSTLTTAGSVDLAWGSGGTYSLAGFSGQSALYFRIYGWSASNPGNDARMWIDNVVVQGADVTPVPEPANIALLLFAFGAAGLHTGRRILKRQ